MAITYNDIKHRLQPPLDCAGVEDLRGRYFHNRSILNYENTDFTGCVLYHCYPSGIIGAMEYIPAQSEEDVTLKGADLRGANLQEADLQGADLQGADLRGADLFKANLQGANLQGANLEDANLEEAEIGRAILQGANLQGANFYEAGLHRTNLQGAKYNSSTRHLASMTIEQQLSMIFVEDDED